jgi:hypothetical protein
MKFRFAFVVEAGSSCGAARRAYAAARGSCTDCREHATTAMSAVCLGIASSRPSMGRVVAFPPQRRPWLAVYVKMTETTGILLRDIILAAHRRRLLLVGSTTLKCPQLIQYGAMVCGTHGGGGGADGSCARSVHLIDSVQCAGLQNEPALTHGRVLGVPH